MESRYNNSMLLNSYSAENFNKEAMAVMELIEKELKQVRQGGVFRTIERREPEEELEFWSREFRAGAEGTTGANESAAPNSPDGSNGPDTPNSPDGFKELAGKIMDHSIHFHSPGYVGHQVAVPLPVTALTSALIGYLNNCTTVYELGMAGNAMEKVVISHMAEKFGYDRRASGFVTSGGSLGNLTALVTARTSSGVAEKDFSRLAIMVSEEAHYSVERAAKIMGIPSGNIIKVPVNDDFTVRTDLLETFYDLAAADGKIVFCVVGCACTTSVGAHDDLEAIGEFAERHGIWFHVDGAHGGAAIFSEKYKGLLRGIERSDSLIVDFHKMMMAPSLSTAVIYNARDRKVSEVSPKAAYLGEGYLAGGWWNSAKHTLECTKPLTVIHTYAIMRLYGDEIYRENVDTLYDLGRAFGEFIEAQPDMELALKPCCNIVCFRYVPERGDADEVNRRISEELLQDGMYYTVSTMVRGEFFLRVTLMNPLTGMEELHGLVEKIREIAGAVCG